MKYIRSTNFQYSSNIECEKLFLRSLIISAYSNMKITNIHLMYDFADIIFFCLYLQNNLC